MTTEYLSDGADPPDPLFEGDGEMAALMRAKDWSRTPLGPPAGWDRSLRTVVRILLTSRYAMWMGWGSELTFFYNDAYRPTLGTKHPWALGRSAKEVWAEIWPAIGPRIDVVLRRGEATWDEGLLLFLERRGYPEETYHTFSYSPLPDDRGAVGGMLCVVTEETDRIIGARRLALLRDLASQLAATNATDEVFAAAERCLTSEMRDIPFSLTYLFEDGGRRARLVSRTGIAADHLSVKPVIDLGQDRSALWPLADIFAHGTMTTVDLPGPPGSWPCGPWPRPAVQALAAPLAEQGQARPAGVFIAGLNPHRPMDDGYSSFIRLFIGQLAAGLANTRAYEAERRRAEALAAIDRAKTAFFSNVSHEFRTPLTLMLGPLQDQLDGVRGALPPAVREDIQIVYRNAVRLLKLVNSLLDFSRLEAGRVSAFYEPTDLATLTRDLASAFRSAVERAGLTLTVDTPPMDAPVHVDREMWEKIVLNLLSNALKFTFDGGITVSLRPADDQPDAVTLRVQDTGVGIPAHEMPRLFERFHRVEGTRARTHEGSGIGLALVQELVKLHGGSVRAQSTVEVGTTFTVTIPIATARAAETAHSPKQLSSTALGITPFVDEAMRWLPQAAADAEAPAEKEVAAASATARILLADDNADMRAYVQRLLQGRWQVESVADGVEALAAARARRPDLVLTDVMMPNMDGFALLRELRADPNTATVPVLMLSARAGEESKVEGLHAGADDYLVKPFSARELVARIETHLLLARTRAAAESERAKLHGLFMRAPAIICVLKGPDHVFELANPLYVQIIGNRPVLGRRIRDVLPDVVDQGYFELLDHVYKTGEPYVGKEARLLVDRSGTGRQDEMFVNFVFQPSFEASGTVDGVLIFGFEVTDQVRARRHVEDEHQAAEQSRAQAEAAVRVRDEFLSVASHELRTPLTALSLQTDGALRMLRRSTSGDQNASLIRKIETVQRQTRRLEQLINSLLDVSRITGGRLALELERIDLSAVVHDVCERFGEEATRVGSEIVLQASAGVTGMWDPMRIDQIVTNLMSNALKYGRGKPIEVTVTATPEQARISVRDHGIGVAAQDQERIFGRFERAVSERNFGGLGLGLWISRQVAEAMKGEISIASAPSQGATFTLSLPITPEPPPEAL